ncbi:MAG TPA: LysE family translocator [Burkholderiaceae bacterium]
MDSTLWTLYLAALIGAYIIPGPDMMMVVAVGAARGARTAMLTALGLALSRSVQVLLSGLGLAALIAAHPRMLDAIRWAGAAYLCLLAWRVLRASGDAPTAGPAAPERSYLLRGFLTNLLNPKALLFYSLVLPQFVKAGQPLALQYFALGAVLVAMGLVFDFAYALLSARAARSFAARSQRPAWIRKTGRLLLPGMLFAMSAKLVLA